MEDREDANALDLRVFLRLAWARKTSPSPLRQTDPANHLHGPGHNSLPLSLWRTFSIIRGVEHCVKISI